MFYRLLVLLVIISLPLQAAERVELLPSQQSMLHDFNAATIAKGLVVPWSINWLPTGEMLIAERPGRLRVLYYEEDGPRLSEPVVGVPEVHHTGAGGLFDVLPHPEFEANQLLFLSFATTLGRKSGLTVVRGRFELSLDVSGVPAEAGKSGGKLSDLETVFQAAVYDGYTHNYGGRMAFDEQGYLYLTVGERLMDPNWAPHPAQDLADYRGTIIRLHDDGRIPADNPFQGSDSALPEIWSYGHRNSAGLSFHPITGDLWSSELGPQGGDELNLIKSGANYGWPVIGYGVNYGEGTPIHAVQQAEDMEQPKHYWVPSISPAGLMIYDGDLFPQWRGDAFVAGMSGRRMARLDMDETGKQVVLEETLLSGFGGRLRDVRQGPDDAIYVASNRTILRLTPVLEHQELP